MNKDDKPILDKIDKVMQSGYGSDVERFFAIGEAIQQLLAAGILTKIASASQHVAYQMQKRGHGKEYSHLYFYDAHTGAARMTKAQQKIIAKARIPVTKVRYLITRPDPKYRNELVKAIHTGELKWPYPRLRHKAVRVGEKKVSSHGRDTESINHILIDLTPPIDVELLINKLSAILCRLPEAEIQGAVDRAKRVAREAS